ncbi:MAG TPA: ribokinase [Geminicoccaceae bacterium]|nr:ribokinase [Geminicoccaceae bacterium]
MFGSINVDLLFRVETLPRPGETVLCPSYELAAGGKGANQATAAARAGAVVRMIGHLGDDAFGHFAHTALTVAGVDCTHVVTSRRATGIAVIGVDRAAENQIMVASGANRDTRAEQVVDADLAPGITLLCQNEVPPAATFALLERAKARGARTILNLAPAGATPPQVLSALDVLVVNEMEGRLAAGESEAADVAEFARDLAQTHQLTCVVTLGAAGALAIGPEGGQRIAALPIEPLDTTGAGDTFVGVLAASLDLGHDLDTALRRASVAAGLACTGLGAQTSQPTAAQIEARLGDLPAATPVR